MQGDEGEIVGLENIGQGFVQGLPVPSTMWFLGGGSGAIGKAHIIKSQIQ